MLGQTNKGQKNRDFYTIFSIRISQGPFHGLSSSSASLATQCHPSQFYFKSAIFPKVNNFHTAFLKLHVYKYCSFFLGF